MAVIASLTQILAQQLGGRMEIPVQLNGVAYSTDYGSPINVSGFCHNYSNGFKKQQNDSGSTVFSSYHVVRDENGHGRISPFCEVIVDKDDTVSGILYHDPVTLSMIAYSPTYEYWNAIFAQALSIFGINFANPQKTIETRKKRREERVRK